MQTALADEIVLVSLFAASPTPFQRILYYPRICSHYECGAEALLIFLSLFSADLGLLGCTFGLCLSEMIGSSFDSRLIYLGFVCH